jgi:hypothetical protein
MVKLTGGEYPIISGNLSNNSDNLTHHPSPLLLPLFRFNFRSSSLNQKPRKILFEYVYTVKKVIVFFPPQPGCHQPNSPSPGIIYVITPCQGDFG